jgi:putative ABC transport system substrate-binding protein
MPVRATRRNFIHVTVASAVSMAGANLWAQPTRTVIVGFLWEGPQPVGPNPALDALRQTLTARGWTEGQNLVIKIQSATDHPQGLQGAISELIAQHPDVLVVISAYLVDALLSHTRTIPIVALAAGVLSPDQNVASLARPGGNVTGMQILSNELMAKRLQFLKEFDPSLVNVAVLRGGNYLPAVLKAYRDATEAGAAHLKMKLRFYHVDAARELDSAFGHIVQDGNRALLVWGNPQIWSYWPQVRQLAVNARLPHLCELGVFSEALLIYGPTAPAVNRDASVYVDRILRGARPADLPILQPTRFELVVNVKTARMMGLAVPRSLLEKADEVVGG